jgi:hypothetical protein
MKKNGLIVLLTVVLLIARPAMADEGIIDSATLDKVKNSLIETHGEQNSFRIERGVDQAAQFWTEEDGSLEEFAGMCNEYFVGSPERLAIIFQRLETNSEVILGYFTEMRVDLRRSLQLDWGEILPIDIAFGQFNPAAHLTDDFYKSKIAFLVLLNFPHYSLEEKTRLGPEWSRKEWAYARTGDAFTSRTPASVNQKITEIATSANTYISQYNIYVGNLIDDEGNTFFPAELKLISHWGLRDEIKARYNDPEGLPKQKMLYRVMNRIIDQEIPEIIVDNQDYKWNPFSNKVYRDGEEISVSREPDARYQHFLDMSNAMKLLDSYNPYQPSHILRRFEVNREIPEAEVEELFTEFISSRVVRKVAKLISERLDRELLPYDIWYDGFRGNAAVTEEELDRIVIEKYPNLEAFEGDIQNILVKLGFSDETAASVAPKIRVDPARGAGHCVGAGAKLFRSRLRTRVPPGGMNYKGFNTAMHELGHAVEQTLTLQEIDFYSLSGVPNTAFTEAFAFVFQDRDLEVLGIKSDESEARHLKALDVMWNAYEIMGVSLVDMKAWNWLYDHPDATAEQLHKAVSEIAREVWNKYYSDIFGIKDEVILAVYSHMISNALYLPDYPLGHVIQFQIEKFLEGKDLGSEMTRMCDAGNIIPQLWMENAVDSEISSEPLLRAADEALKHIKE